MSAALDLPSRHEQSAGIIVAMAVVVMLTYLLAKATGEQELANDTLTRAIDWGSLGGKGPSLASNRRGMVPRDGFEPPTPRFSAACSTN